MKNKTRPQRQPFENPQLRTLDVRCPTCGLTCGQVWAYESTGEVLCSGCGNEFDTDHPETFVLEMATPVPKSVYFWPGGPTWTGTGQVCTGGKPVDKYAASASSANPAKS